MQTYFHVLCLEPLFIFLEVPAISKTLHIEHVGKYIVFGN